jgi:hypothetical protein
LPATALICVKSVMEDPKRVLSGGDIVIAGMALALTLAAGSARADRQPGLCEVTTIVNSPG